MTTALSLMLLAAMAWWSLRWIPAGADGRMPLPFLIALIRFLWIPVMLVAAFAAAQRYWGLAFTGLALALLFLQGTSPYYHHPLARRGQRADVDDVDIVNDVNDVNANVRDDGAQSVSSLNVMTLNCRYGHADAAQIVHTVTEHNVDVLALQELTESLIGRLQAAGLQEALPYRQLGEPGPQDNGGFNGIWTRYRPLRSTAESISIPAAQVPAITLPAVTATALPTTALPATTATITLASAHPKSPMRGCRQWSEGIMALAALIPRPNDDHGTDIGRAADTLGRNDPGETAPAPDARAVVVMGDLNSDYDHPSFRSLLRAGYRDAGLERGRGPLHTFPAWLHWPGLDLDHVLLGGGTDAYDLTATRIDGSDHLALNATVAISPVTARMNAYQPDRRPRRLWHR